MLKQLHRILPALLLAALLAPTGAAAQTIVFGDAARRAWLGISYQTELERSDGVARRAVRITEVVAGSPAEQAGLLAGDTIVSVNDIPASDQLLGSLAFSLGPGESVRLRIRRDGREQELTIVTAERPAGVFGFEGRGVFTIDMDSILDLTRTMLDSARWQVDTLNMPRIFLPPTQMMPDSLRARIMHRLEFDTIAPGRIRYFSLDGDTLLRAELDSVARRIAVGRMGELPLGPDSLRVRFSRAAVPGSFEGTTFFAMRAVGGAELADIDPAMETYFGARDGVLVLRVGDGTPAARAGLRPGDVIVGVDDQPVSDTAQFRRMVAQAERGRPIRLEILRERRALRLELRGGE